MLRPTSLLPWAPGSRFLTCAQEAHLAGQHQCRPRPIDPIPRQNRPRRTEIASRTWSHSTPQPPTRTCLSLSSRSDCKKRRQRRLRKVKANTKRNMAARIRSSGIVLSKVAPRALLVDRSRRPHRNQPTMTISWPPLIPRHRLTRRRISPSRALRRLPALT